MKVLERRGFWFALVLLWVVAALIYWRTHSAAIATHGFPDPDDAMRLQEVRDWLGGQSWFDVGQHRMNAPWGTTMHWSRLVDLPIAGAIILLRPLAGPAAAESAALVLVPLLTMLCVMVALAAASRRLLSPGEALLAAALVPLTVGAIQQLQPLRIDHHGWQMAFAAAMLAGMLDERSRRGGAIAGAALAAWLTVSLEGLPLGAAAGGWLALRWIFASSPDPGAVRLRSFALALGLTSLLLFIATHAPGRWLETSCDALSGIHVAALLAVTIGVTFTVRLVTTTPRRLLGLTATALVAALLYRVGAPRCSAGAFAGMDPLVHRYWYDNVVEGLPVWRQSASVAVTGLGAPLLGLIGTVLAWRSSEGAVRERWLDALALLAAATLVALLVQRASAAASILALPGSAYLIARAVTLAQRIPVSAVRVPVTACAALALLPITPAVVAASIIPRGQAPKPSTCATAANYRAARALPPGILLTNIDIGPGLLIETGHPVVASGHHRNQSGLHDAIVAFVGSESEAHEIFRRRGVSFLVVCPDMREMSIYAQAAPHGFWAYLRGGQVPRWLEPVRLPNSQLRVWRVIG